MSAQNQKSIKLFSVLLVLAIVACAFIGESMAGKDKGGEDIILYNGNIVLRGSGKKGKGGGNIVVANSNQGMDIMPFMGGFDGFGRR